jgi:hypothetical protein
MHGPINVKSPDNISEWQMGINSAFKGLTNKIEIKPKSPKESNLTQIYTGTACEPPRGGGGDRQKAVVSQAGS